MQSPLPKASLLVCALATPLLAGIYINNKLSKSYTSHLSTSEGLSEILKQVLKNFELERLIYANSPGSFMGLKVAYISLKSISIINGCPLFGVDGFIFSKGKAIRASKNKSFIKNGSSIKLSDEPPAALSLPQDISGIKLNDDNLPQYFSPAV